MKENHTPFLRKAKIIEKKGNTHEKSGKLKYINAQGKKKKKEKKEIQGGVPKMELRQTSISFCIDMRE